MIVKQPTDTDIYLHHQWIFIAIHVGFMILYCVATHSAAKILTAALPGLLTLNVFYYILTTFCCAVLLVKLNVVVSKLYIAAVKAKYRNDVRIGAERTFTEISKDRALYRE